MPECRSCNAPIFWGTTENGKREPVDLEPVDGGNIEVVSRERQPDGEIKIRHLKKGEAESATLFEPPPRYVSHFATCPNARSHRKDS